MLISILNQLWQQVNPTGEIERHPTRGMFWVTYQAGRKVYEYRASSVYALAERFDLIPEVHVEREAKRIVAELAQGASEIIAPAGCGDTANHLWFKAGHSLMIDNECAGVDEYERPLARFFVADLSAWSSTVTRDK